MDLLQGYSSSDEAESENEKKVEVFPKMLRTIVEIAPPVDFFNLSNTDIQSDDAVDIEPRKSHSPIPSVSNTTEIVDLDGNEKEEGTSKSPILEEFTRKSPSIDSITDESSSSSSKSNSNEETPKTQSETQSMDVDDQSKEAAIPSNEIIDLDCDDIESETPIPEKEVEKTKEIPLKLETSDSITLGEILTTITDPVVIENNTTIELIDSDNENDVDITLSSVAVLASTSTSTELSSDANVTNTEATTIEIQTETEISNLEKIISEELLPKRVTKIFTKKDCINYDCMKKCKTFVICPIFVLNYYTIPRKPNKLQFVCEDCYDLTVASFEELCGSLEDEQPLLWQKLPNRVDHVDICDSDEEDESESDKRHMTKEELQLLSEKFEDSLAKTLARVNISQQMKWTETIIRTKINANEAESNKIAPELKRMQKLADEMYHSLYSTCEIRYTDLEPLDLNSESQTSNKPASNTIPSKIPLPGAVIRDVIKIGEVYFAVRQKFLSAWSFCEVLDIIDGDISVIIH